MSHSPTLAVMMAVAAREATAAGSPLIEPAHLLLAVLTLAEERAPELGRAVGGEPLAALLGDESARLRQRLATRGLEPTGLRRRLRAALPAGDPNAAEPRHRSPASRLTFERAERLAAGDRVGLEHLLGALLESPPLEAAAFLDEGTPVAPGIAPTVLDGPSPAVSRTPTAEAEDDADDLAALAERLRRLRDRLRATVLGQEAAVQAFVDGLFAATVVADVDDARRRPQAVFVFAGPPGVGKTLLAETGAEALGRPFRRFDMSGYADHASGALLVGMAPAYRGAEPGQLTGFVDEHPNAVLLFDEIEKAHLEVVHLFLQLLDAGRLEDQHTGRTVAFRDTLVIFTTNAGASLYNRRNATGVQRASARFHRRTLLDALAHESDPRTGRPAFPAAICSRLATGYPLLFDHLGVGDLVRLAAAELARQAELIGRRHGLAVTIGDAVALAVVLAEGARADARTVRARAEVFLRHELFALAGVLEPARLRAALAAAPRLEVELDREAVLPAEVAALIAPAERSQVLVVAGAALAERIAGTLPDVDVHRATSAATIEDLLAGSDVDLVLLDLWLGATGAVTETVRHLDRVPLAAAGLAAGLEILRLLHERHPELPCYLLSATGDRRAEVDDELLLACLAAGGARGVVAVPAAADAESDRDLATRLDELALTVRREHQAAALADQHLHLAFDTVPRLADDGGPVAIRLRNLRLVRAAEAADAGALVEGVERPALGFADVLGADAAKLELGHIAAWLREPKRFAGLGLKPPRGILLYGPPGTGKTHLARALAGESSVAFLVAAASSFVTMWQGSGPQSVRDLFERARRYAPAIVFIDEIDAVGKKRIGAAGANAAAEQTLNALLTEMDGFAVDPSRPVVVLAATNLVELLDPALRRRFDREVEVDRPDRAARHRFLDRRLVDGGRHRVSPGLIDRLAGSSAGLTIADLERIVQHAARLAARGDGVITDELLEHAFDTARLGEARGVTDPDTLLRIARHEAGHCLVGWLDGDRPVQVSVMARGATGGFVEREADEDRPLLTRPELEARLRGLLAGRAAELVCYGPEAGPSTGAASDLETATRLAESMVCRWAMDPELGPAVTTLDNHTGPPPEARAAVSRLLARQLAETVSRLETERPALDRLTDALVERNRLTRAELEELLGPR